jgi:sulfoxide reductase catalytic subunit YedY
MHYHRDRGHDHRVASEITPRAVYEGRREHLKRLAAGAAGPALAAFAARDALASVQRPGRLAPLPGARSTVAGASTMEKLTSYKDATTYNNFYEFGTDKEDPARLAHTLKTRPWTVSIEGEVRKPGPIDIETLLKMVPME